MVTQTKPTTTEAPRWVDNFPEFADWDDDDLRPTEKSPHEYLSHPTFDGAYMSADDLYNVRKAIRQRSQPRWASNLTTSPSHAELLATIADLVDGDKRHCFASVQYLALALNCSKRSVTSWLSDLEAETLIQVRPEYGKSNKVFVLRHQLMPGHWPGERWPDDREREGYGQATPQFHRGPRENRNHASNPGRSPDRRRPLGPDKFMEWASAQLDWTWLDCAGYVLCRVVPGNVVPKGFEEIARTRDLAQSMNLVRARVLQLPEQDRLVYIGMAEQLMERRYRSS